MEIEEAANNGGRENVDIEKASSSAASSSRAAAKNKAAAMYIAWQDLTVVFPNFGKGSTNRLLNGITGFAEPGRIMAIMGPSGSGKSTLLDSLSGRLSRNLVMTGNVLLNGKKKRIDHGRLAYVTQENVLLGTLTVRETITFSARMRLPSSMSSEEINEIVEETIIDMGLHECADTLIGNWHLRGISGGEKKRLSIALEILTRPSLLFLDEPTSGLDSASAFFVVKILKSIAADGRTVISSIHQPSSEVFALFDDLFLLSGGETVYFGEAKLAIQFFAETGYPCPSRRNPSDHFLRCVNSDFDIVTMTLATSNRIHETGLDPLMNIATAEIKALLIRKYRTSKYARIGKARIKEISSLEGLPVGTQKGSLANWQKQLSTLTQRSFINMCRDLGYYWFRILVYIVLSVSVGTVFFKVGTSYHAILARGACGGFLSGYMAMMSIGGFPSFVEEMKVFSRERLSGYYGVAVYILSNFISSFPFLVTMSIASVSITYFMVKFHPGFSRFMYAFIDLLLSISTVESCMMIIASLVPNYMMGVAIGAGYIGIIMMTSGFFRMTPDLPKLFWRYPFSYLNYGAWGLEGAYKNDMLGLEFDASTPDGQKLKGEYILENRLGVQIHYSKWWDLAAVLIILIAYRVSFFFILKFKERASPLFRALYAKRTLHRLSKRPSFRKMPAFPSSRHQPLHPLSSQEGLQSPIK